jgi:hypothetical protein
MTGRMTTGRMATGMGGQPPIPSGLVRGRVRVRLALLPVCALAAVLAGAVPASARVIAPAGTGAGQVNLPLGVAVDQSTGILYVADRNNFRIDEFTRTGSFVRAFGSGVRDGASKPEICTEETTCREGNGAEGPPETPGSGSVEPVGGIAVNSSTHDVYISDDPLGNRVDEYTEGGVFITMFGEGVDKGPVHPGDICSAAFIKEGDTCGYGTSSANPGAFNSDARGLPLAIDASGDVWVGDQNRLEKFSASGVFLEELALPGAGGLISLGLGALGEFFVLESADESVHKLDAKGTQLLAVDGPPGAPRALALGAANQLFVGDDAVPYHIIQYNATSGEEEEVFGAGSIAGRPDRDLVSGDVLAFDNATGTIDAASSLINEPSFPERVSAVVATAVPAPGPLQRGLGTEGVRGTHVTLTNILDAEGAETEYQFQYVDDATFKADGGGHEFDHALSTTVAKLPAGFAETPVTSRIEGLKSETTYHFRVLAHNAHGDVQTAESASENAIFTTPPAVEISAEYVTGVTPDSATLNASINPEGLLSSFHFEYLPASAYQANLEADRDPFTGATVAPVADGSLGSGEAAVTVAQTVGGLTPAVAYRFRVVGTNSGGVVESPTKAFNTQSSEEAKLPDGREWELVSPLEKNGGLFEPIGDSGIQQAASGGGGITYLATRPTEETPEGYLIKEQVLSERTPEGWVSHDISLPHETAPGVSIGGGEDYRFFSQDLSVGVAQPFGVFDPAVSDLATEDTPLLRSNFVGEGTTTPCVSSQATCYQPLLIGCPTPGQECSPAVENHADVPAGTRFGFDPATLEPCVSGHCGVQFVGASPDSTHIVLESVGVGLTALAGDHGGLYEWYAGQLSLVSVLPSGAPAQFGSPSEVPSLGRNNVSAASAVSSDGTRVDWTFGGHLYQRNLTTGKTLQLDVPGAGAGGKSQGTEPEFQSASADGRIIFFTDEQKLLKQADPAVKKPDLYRCVLVEAGSTPKCELTDLTPAGDVQGEFLGSSTDGSYVYFVANGVLASGATAGGCENKVDFKPNVECNVYMWHEGAIEFVAQLSGEDQPDWRRETSRETSRVSPDGQWLEFMSQRSLTGYENTDARSGMPDEEVFLFSASTDRLACVSCNPTGERPVGAEYGGKATASGGDRVWQTTSWLAANVPGWTSYKSGSALYQSRYLANSGRLFFDSHDSLSGTDTNSAEDVYEFEPAGVGGCTAAAGSFVAANGGCLNLISSGTSPVESAFLDASESGNDVFFLTAARLARGDEDKAADVYDAHVCQTSDPCLAPPPAAVAPCSGEACQPQVAGPSESAVASLLVSGLGNLTPPPATRPQLKPKPMPRLTPAQRFTRALQTCRRQHSRKARRRCEMRARQAYRATAKHPKRARRIP